MDNPLKDIVDKYSYVDIGKDVEKALGISRNRFQIFVGELIRQNYQIYYVQARRKNSTKRVTVRVLAKPDIKYWELLQNKDKIYSITIPEI